MNAVSDFLPFQRSDNLTKAASCQHFCYWICDGPFRREDERQLYAVLFAFHLLIPYPFTLSLRVEYRE